MPAILANAPKFLSNSDYPVDKIVYLKEASYTFDPAVSFGDVTIPHGLPFTPLPVLQWSFNADFGVAYEDNTGPFPGPYGFPFTFTLVIQADSTNIKIRSNSTIGAQLAYVRLFCFAPSDYTGEVASTASVGDSFVLNSDNNYMKLVDSGKVSVASGGTATVAHSLGTYPHVLAWLETSTGIVMQMSLSYPLVNINMEVGTTGLTIRNDSFNILTTHYRMYHNA